MQYPQEDQHWSTETLTCAVAVDLARKTRKKVEYNEHPSRNNDLNATKSTLERLGLLCLCVCVCVVFCIHPLAAAIDTLAW